MNDDRWTERLYYIMGGIMMLLTPGLLCHKDTMKGCVSVNLWAGLEKSDWGLPWPGQTWPTDRDFVLVVITTVKDMIIDQYEGIVAAQSYTVLHCTKLGTTIASSFQLGESCRFTIWLQMTCLMFHRPESWCEGRRKSQSRLSYPLPASNEFS